MKNKWVVLFAGIIIQTVLGGIYAWSTFVPELVEKYALTKAQCGFIFGLKIGVFTLAMILAGWVFTKRGPRFTAIIGSLLYMSGFFLAFLSKGNYIYLLLSFGIVTGSGIGFGYVCPLATGMKWFPEKKGLITGISVAGFGGGAVLFSYFAQHFFSQGLDVLELFRYISLGFGTLILIASMFLSEPDFEQDKVGEPVSMSAVYTAPFIISFLCIFAGTFSGLLVIGNLVPMVVKAGLSAEHTAMAISVFALGNAIGRVFWGFAFDRLSFKSIPISLFCSALFLLIFIFPVPSWALLIGAGLLGFGFGSNFVIYAATISRFFGTNSFSRIYPLCFLGYGIAGLTGPGVGGAIFDKFSSYSYAIYLSIGITMIAFIISGLGLKVFKNKKKE